METKFDLIFLTLLIVMGVGTYLRAKDLNKSPRIVYLLDLIFGVIIGLLVGYLRSDISFGLMIGVFVGFLFVLGGVVTRWQIRKFTELEDKHTKEIQK
jgi:high-affinity Fe2+/Pb2+ permease